MTIIVLGSNIVKKKHIKINIKGKQFNTMYVMLLLQALHSKAGELSINITESKLHHCDKFEIFMKHLLSRFIINKLQLHAFIYYFFASYAFLEKIAALVSQNLYLCLRVRDSLSILPVLCINV